MAVTYIGNALSGTAGTTDWSITLPTTQVGDVLVVDQALRGDATPAALGGTSGLTWTQKQSQTYNSATSSVTTFWARATGDHSGTTVTASNLGSSAVAVLTQYRGALSTGDPLAAATVVSESNASGNETQGQITTLMDAAWVVLCVAADSNVDITTQACTTPGSLTERAQVISTAGTPCAIAHASAEMTTAGATGAFTWAQTDAEGGSIAYAIQPGASAAITGTATASITEADIVAGGKTVIVTLTGATWNF